MGESPERLTSLAARVSAAATNGPTIVGVDRDRASYVRDAEVDVAALVAVREPGGGRGGGVGCVGLDEAQEIEEGAFAEHVEKQRGGGEVVLVEQGAQGQLGGRQRISVVSARERALGEDLDVSRFVVDVAAEPQDQFDELRVDLRQEPGRHVEGGVFVLGQERHDLGNGPFGRVVQALRGFPGDVAGGVPLLAGRLVDELADVVGPDRVAAAESPVVRRRSRSRARLRAERTLHGDRGRAEGLRRASRRCAALLGEGAAEPRAVGAARPGFWSRRRGGSRPRVRRDG